MRSLLSKEQAFGQCSMLSMEVHKSTGLPLWIFIGFKGTMVNPSQGFSRYAPKWVGHVVCLDGDTVVDYTGAQFGDIYPKGPRYKVEEGMENWLYFGPWTPWWIPDNKWLKNNVGLLPHYSVKDQ